VKQNETETERRCVDVMYIFPKRMGTYYTFLSILDCIFLFNYLQLWRSYAILCATTQRIFAFH